MRKIVILSVTLLSVSLFISACNTQTVIKTNEEKYGYVAFPGTDWGMSVEECINGLGLKDNSVEVKTDTAQPDVYKFFEAIVNYKGAQRLVKFTFTTQYEGSDTYELGLTSVKIPLEEYNGIDDAKLFSDLLETYENDFKKRGIPHNGKGGNGGNAPSAYSSTIENDNSLSSLEDSEIKARALEIANYGKEDNMTVWDKWALDEVGVLYRSIDDPQYDGCSVYIIYTGIPAAILNTAEKQIETEKSK